MATAYGSSPLTRGKPRIGHDGQNLEGLIPAHAGKTDGPFCPMRQRRAHPRSCGENSLMDVQNTFCEGSSPLMRGKLEAIGGEDAHTGLIPAHAGKTVRRRHTLRSRRAHPHSCGENDPPSFSRSPFRGSSPLMRGKHGQRRKGLPRGRLIPAHAGKTGSPQPRRCRARAHPRSRGENLVNCNVYCNELGSSPLTRGKPRLAAGCQKRSGLIPAHAGKTGRIG